MTLTWQKVLLIVAFVLVGIAGAILATWLDWPHPAAFLTFGACAWLGSQLQMAERTTVEVYEAKDGWRWRMKAGNGEIIADSAEAYATKSNADRAVTRAFGRVEPSYPEGQVERMKSYAEYIAELPSGVPWPGTAAESNAAIRAHLFDQTPEETMSNPSNPSPQPQPAPQPQPQPGKPEDPPAT